MKPKAVAIALGIAAAIAGLYLVVLGGWRDQDHLLFLGLGVLTGGGGLATAVVKTRANTHAGQDGSANSRASRGDRSTDADQSH